MFIVIWSHYVRPTTATRPSSGVEGSEGPDTGGLVSQRVRGISLLNICLGGTDGSSISFSSPGGLVALGVGPPPAIVTT